MKPSARGKAPAEYDTNFLNVDLDVFSRASLEPLAVAFGPRVLQLYVGRDGGRYRAHFELSAASRTSADAVIVGLVRLVKSLPRAARTVWNEAYRRDFNIGVQGGFWPRSYELSLKPETLKLVSSVNARVVLTIYAAEMPERETRPRAREPRSRKRPT